MNPSEVKAKELCGARSRTGGPRRTAQRSRWHWLAFGLFTAVAARAQAEVSAASKADPGGSPTQLILTVRVLNYAELSAGTLRRAQGEAARIIADAGVETAWLDCTTLRPASLLAQGSGRQECTGLVAGTTVTLRVLNRSDYNSATVHREVFGYADGPALASVLYDRVAALAEADLDMNEATVILGYVMAHEIGHLLLGPSTHSSTGIMRGQWDRAQLRRALMGRQRFTPEQSTSIRAAVEAPMKVTEGGIAVKIPAEATDR